MIRKNIFLILIVCAILMLSACGSNQNPEPVPIDFGFDFFPVEVGAFREYNVLQVDFLTAGPDTSRFFLREAITDSIVNGESISYILERSTRMSMDDPWQLDSVWTTRVTNMEAIQVENNVPFVKLQFPVMADDRWDVNAFNTRMEFFYNSRFIDTDTLDNVYEVVISDVIARPVLQDQRSEFYARGIGLIRRDFINITFCQMDCNAAMEIMSGQVLDQRLIRFGNE